MSTTGISSFTIKYTATLLIILLAQILICNNILLFGVAVPFVYLYLIIALPVYLNTNWLLTIAFLMGFIVDIFGDTLGMNTLAITVTAMLKRPVFYAYVPKDDKYTSALPSLEEMGWIDYGKFILTLTFIFCLLIFCIDYLSFGAIWRILLMAVSSTVLTCLLILAVDAVVNTRKESF